jgi:cytochrome P450
MCQQMRRPKVHSLPRFVLDDEEAMKDPYPVYRRLRDYGPVCRGGPGQWVVPRYREVSALLRDPRLGREFPAEYQALSVGEGAANEFLRRIVIDRDPLEHTRLRKALTKALNPALVRSLAGAVTALVDDMLRDVGDRGIFDAVHELAVPVPIAMMSELFDIPHADRRRVRDWSIDLAQAFAVFIPEERRAVAHHAVILLREYMTNLLAERRRRPGEDLLSRMIATGSADESPLTDEEIVDNAVFIYYAGFETTTNLIATGCHILTEYPAQQQRLRDEPSLLPTAIEEFLRYDAPIHATTRLALAPIEIGDYRIRPGRVVVLLLASANRDERVFSAPDTVDVSRKHNQHLSFGGGVHHCLGAVLARWETAAVFERLLERYSVIEPAGPVRWNPSSGGFRYPYWALESIPVQAQCAPRKIFR